MPLRPPRGLETVTGVNADTAGASWVNIDPFHEAIAEAEPVGATLTSFVASPATALALAKLKTATNSNQDLLQADPTQATRRMIAGVPLYVSAGVADGTVWGLDSSRNLIVRRKDITVDVSRDAFFSSDRVAVRATARYGFAFPRPASIQKITLTAGAQSVAAKAATK